MAAADKESIAKMQVMPTLLEAISRRVKTKCQKKPGYRYPGLRKKSWHRATLPQSHDCNTIAAGGLNF
jgi:hypothetical protein